LISNCQDHSSLITLNLLSERTLSPEYGTLRTTGIRNRFSTQVTHKSFSNEGPSPIYLHFFTQNHEFATEKRIKLHSAFKVLLNFHYGCKLTPLCIRRFPCFLYQASKNCVLLQLFKGNKIIRKGSMNFLSLARPGKESKVSSSVSALQKPRSKKQLNHEMSVDSISSFTGNTSFHSTELMGFSITSEPRSHSNFSQRATRNSVFNSQRQTYRRHYVGGFAAAAYEAARFDAESSDK